MPNPLDSLPHGPGFRFIDELLELVPGQRARARYTVPAAADLELLRGHFPGEPLLPGVVLIEMIAQLGGALLQSDPHQAPLPNLRLAAVRQAKISGSAQPGETLEISAELIQRQGSLGQLRGRVLNAAGNELARAEIILAAAAESAPEPEIRA